MTKDIGGAERFIKIPLIESPFALGSVNAIGYLSNQTGPVELYLYNLDSQRCTQLTESDLPKSCTENPNRWNICWSERQRKFYFPSNLLGDGTANLMSVDLNGDVESGEKFENGCLLHDLSGNYIVYSDSKKHLHLYDMEADDRVEISNGSIATHLGVSFDPLGKRVGFQTINGDTDIFVFSIDELDLENHCINGSTQISFNGWYCTNRILVTGFDDNKRMGVYSILNREINWLGKGEIICSLPNDDGVVGIMNDHPIIRYKEEEEEEITIDGTSVSLLPPGRSIFLSDDCFIIRNKSTRRPFGIHLCDVSTGHSQRIVEPDITNTDTSELTTPDEIIYPGANGEKNEALIWDCGQRPTPVIAILYGAHQDITPLFNRRALAFAKLGYSVIRPEHNQLPYHNNEDFYHLGKWLKSEDWVDSDNRVLYGHSHGGYDVLMQMTRWPHLWDSGIVWNGIADLFSANESGFIKSQLGDPQANKQKWATHNPISKAHKIRSPLLLLYGGEDPNHSHGEKFHSAVPESMSKKVELVELNSQGHHPRNIDEQMVAFNEMTDFLL